jgi:uncharacterized protein (UPF0179 family)
MAYRTKTYLAGAWTEDNDAFTQLYAWKNGNRWNLDFHDAHEVTQARDSSQYCSIKKSLAQRIDVSKTFILVVSTSTKSRRAGECNYCFKNNECGNSSNKSFIEFECDKAARDYTKGEIKQIVVLYNASSVDKSKCPYVLKDIGIHKEMKTFAIFDYNKVKTALGQL